MPATATAATSCAYSSNISWRGEATPVAKEVDPRLVFERLFANGDPGDTEESIERRRIYRHSILDFVMEDADAPEEPQLGTHDQSKLDEYFTGVREIEQRLERAEKSNAALDRSAAERPRRPACPPTIGEHIRLMGDMMVLAFQADLTRICTFMVANDGSNRSYKADRRARRASRLFAPRRQPGQAGQGAADQHSSTSRSSPISWRRCSRSRSRTARCSTTP